MLQSRKLLGTERFEAFNRSMAKSVAATFGGEEEQIYQRAVSGDFGLGDLMRGSSPTTPAAAPDPKSTGSVPASTSSGANGKAPPENQKSQDLFSRIVSIQTEQVAGKELKNPMAARLVGGYAVMFLLMAVSSSAATLFEEKSSGVFQRLLAAPVRPAHILWARFLFGMTLGLTQITSLVLAGWIFFGLEIFNHAGALLAVMLGSAAACSAFGMLVAAIAPSAAAAQGISTFVVLSMSAIGGAWFPTSIMPHYIQSLSKFTLVYWSVEGFADVLWQGRSLLEVLPKVGILAGIALTAMLVAVWCFRRGKLFD
jgi:ABC-2 type transport system permease protein